MVVSVSLLTYKPCVHGLCKGLRAALCITLFCVPENSQIIGTCLFCSPVPPCAQIHAVRTGHLQHPLLHDTWLELHRRAASYYCDALSSGTARVYDKHAKYWARFCVLFGMQSEFRAPTEDSAVLFVCWLSLSNQPTSVRTTMSGVKYFWASLGAMPDVSGWVVYNRVMTGMRRQKGGMPNRKHPISPQDLTFMMSRLDVKFPFAAAMRACMLTTWWGMLRKSNTTVGNTNLLDTGASICPCDVVIDRVSWSVTLNVRKSKTNQFRDRVHKIVLQSEQGHVLDPVGALIAHMELNKPGDNDALFAFREDGRQYQMTHTIFVRVTKILFACMGCDPNAVSGHSYRRGHATTAGRAGVPDALLQMHGDWAGMTYRIYQELSHACRAKLTTAVFALIKRMPCVPMVAAETPWGHLGAGEVRGPIGSLAEGLAQAQDAVLDLS